MGSEVIISNRLINNLKHNCGELLLGVIEDNSVIEIMLNPDGKLWIERYGEKQEHIGNIPEEQSKIILSLVASALGTTVNANNPVVEGLFPIGNARFEGTYPPIVSPCASFSIRKKANKILTFEDYLQSKTITADVIPILQQAIRERQNIMVVGGTSSGKTTFVNAIINELYNICPNDRLLVLEDTPELQSKSPNTVFFQTSEVANITMRSLTKISMRYAPMRILVGEVRDSAALELLKLWNTGHPGGIGTFHADGAEEALERLEELVEEAGNGEKRKLIGRAVDIIVYMKKTEASTRKLTKIIKVNCFNTNTITYNTEVLYDYI